MNADPSPDGVVPGVAGSGERDRLSLRIGPGVSSLATLRDQVHAHLRALSVDETASYAVELALEELAGNVLRYGYAGDEPRRVHAEIFVTRAQVEIVLTDDARPFDPTRHPDPEVPRSLGEAPVGGRGIAMVRRMVGAMRYQRLDGTNRLEIDVPRKVTGSSGERSSPRVGPERP